MHKVIFMQIFKALRTIREWCQIFVARILLCYQLINIKHNLYLSSKCEHFYYSILFKSSASYLKSTISLIVLQVVNKLHSCQYLLAARCLLNVNLLSHSSKIMQIKRKCTAFQRFGKIPKLPGNLNINCRLDSFDSTGWQDKNT